MTEQGLVSKLMFNREQFPIEIGETENFRGQKYWTIFGFTFPPYHPSMAQRGIDIDSAVSVLDEALENTILELSEISDKIPRMKWALDGLTYDMKTRKIQFGNVEREELSVSIYPFPITGRLFIGQYSMNVVGHYGGDPHISIDTRLHATDFTVPKNVVFSPELLEEYKMKGKGIHGDYRFVECPHMWYYHNLDSSDRVFFKNLIIALDNETVRRKYSK